MEGFAMSNVFYFWLGLGLLLMAAETLMPGAFLLWLGIAGVAMSIIVFVFPSLPVLAQAALFAVLALLSVALYRRVFRRREPDSDKPLLNRRAEQLIGRSVVLDQAIEGGRGRVQIGDALWTVAGPDLPVGARVVVNAVDGLVLRVSPSA
jgi:inner membrane protein